MIVTDEASFFMNSWNGRIFAIIFSEVCDYWSLEPGHDCRLSSSCTAGLRLSVMAAMFPVTLAASGPNTEVLGRER